jgi:hypothetical protein
MKTMQDKILTEHKRGNIVFIQGDQLAIAPIAEFVKQPAEGLLYDLNRLPEDVLSWTDDPRWINEFAVQAVIMYLHGENERLRATLGLIKSRGMAHGVEWCVTVACTLDREGE